MRWSGPAALLHVVAATPAAAADDLALALGVTVLLKVVKYDAEPVDFTASNTYWHIVLAKL